MTGLPSAHCAETCAPEVADACSVSTCRPRCALEVIDRMIGSAEVSGAEADLLLDLRWKLSRRDDPEGALRVFCETRLRMEAHHYLDMFRIRRWLEHHLLARVQAAQEGAPVLVPVKLRFYCVEAIRRVCICSALEAADLPVPAAPRLRFEFVRAARNVKPPVPAMS